MEKSEKLFRDKETVKKLIGKLKEYKGKPLKLMEVCGTHTMSISRYGIRSVLPESIKLISGPGCPVCVTPNYYIRSALELARRSDAIITTFGDMMRIPAGDTSLLDEKARGADVRIVYSPLDSLEIAEKNPEKKVIFLSVGFETTIPVAALAVLEAERRQIKNFMLLSANKTIDEALHILSSDKEIGVDGYIYPGHVSAIIGDKLYREIANQHGIPGIITGFEPVEILAAIIRLTELISNEKAAVENLYARVVKPEGNPIALSKVYEVFENCDAAWRGLGLIPSSGLRLKEKFKGFDAWEIFEGKGQEIDEETPGCRCGDILKGKCLPGECGLFGTACTPETPVGSCMVSSEGTCAAYYKYS
ncbi:MAG: hydrogenase formation protein HypD [Clostridia bacterium]|nr:hydrogenase formation protein HypD [Clostridia bacterium]